MGHLVLFRCDNCSQTQPDRDGWFEVGISSDLWRAFNGPGWGVQGPGVTKVLVCSFGCARAWIDNSAEAEWEKIKPGAISVSEAPATPGRKRRKRG